MGKAKIRPLTTPNPLNDRHGYLSMCKCTGKSVKGFFSPHIGEVAHLIKTGLLFWGVSGSYNCVKESPVD